MNCPYCEIKMRRGYIHNPSQPVQWIPEGAKSSNWRGGLAKGAIQLGEDSFWFESKVTAFLCPSCNAVIIPAK